MLASIIFAFQTNEKCHWQDKYVGRICRLKIDWNNQKNIYTKLRKNTKIAIKGECKKPQLFPMVKANGVERGKQPPTVSDG